MDNNETGIWELDTCEGDADTYRPGNLSKILTACAILTAFALIGLALV